MEEIKKPLTQYSFNNVYENNSNNIAPITPKHVTHYQKYSLSQ